MKVILDKDLAPLGEEGDVKDVAAGYARNFLFPRKIAVPYNDHTVKLFESRHEKIEIRRQEKRQDAAGIKERLESLHLELTMPAGANGKLYGAVTSQTISDELVKLGHNIERKRIELVGSNIKSVGKYKVMVKLYENAVAEITVSVLGQEIKTETKTPAARPNRRHNRDSNQAAQPEAEAKAAEPAAAETTAPAAEAAPTAAQPAAEQTAPQQAAAQ
ncbi:MAG: 50S ribosomal protein L9 [Treponema sp.]|nr:50S ribosomal protein L9 [Treponema sp.]